MSDFDWLRLIRVSMGEPVPAWLGEAFAGTLDPARVTDIVERDNEIFFTVDGVRYHLEI